MVFPYTRLTPTFTRSGNDAFFMQLSTVRSSSVSSPMQATATKMVLLVRSLTTTLPEFFSGPKELLVCPAKNL